MRQLVEEVGALCLVHALELGGRQESDECLYCCPYGVLQSRCIITVRLLEGKFGSRRACVLHDRVLHKNRFTQLRSQLLWLGLAKAASAAGDAGNSGHSKEIIGCDAHNS